ncbi:MAG: asparagine synthase-related protein [archaeon]
MPADKFKESAKTLLSLLEKSAASCSEGLTRASLAFSGGLDSAIFAGILRKRIGLELVATGVAGSYDLSNAASAASQLGMPLKQIVLTKEQIWAAADAVSRIITPANRLNVEIAVPFYILSKQITTRHLFAGQGADELFGGYSRYTRSKNALRDMDADTSALPLVINRREARVCNKFGVELLLPYLGKELALYALSLPVEYRISGENRKAVLREAGRLLGLPPAITNQKKKAMQYGSGISKALRGYWTANSAL